MDITLPAIREFFSPIDDPRTRYRLEGEVEVTKLKVRAWSQREASSELYTLEIACLSIDARLDLDSICGARVNLVTRLADGGEHRRGGFVVQVEAERAADGIAGWRLRVAPWLALLGHTEQCRVWQDKSVVEIIDSILGTYGFSVWRWADCVADHLAQSPQHNALGRKSCCVQHHETDLDFVARLLAEEGLIYRFETVNDAPDALVILADTTRAQSCPEDQTSANASGSNGVPFHRLHRHIQQAAERDVILAFGARDRLPVDDLAKTGWHPDARRVIAAAAGSGSANASVIERYDPGGSILDSTQAQRASTLVMQGYEARARTWLGQGSVRSFTSGQYFRLRGKREFLITRVTHAGVNNLPPELSQALVDANIDKYIRHQQLMPAWIGPEQWEQAAENGYANRFEALRRDIPWRAPTYDDHGERLHPRPVATKQIATVVGPNGETTSGAHDVPIDREGRVRVQYDFQRLAYGEEIGNSSTWVRAMPRGDGAGMGWQCSLRIGQEVSINFDDGEFERPYVAGVFDHRRGEGGASATPDGADGAATAD